MTVDKQKKKKKHYCSMYLIQFFVNYSAILGNNEITVGVRRVTYKYSRVHSELIIHRERYAQVQLEVHVLVL